MVSNYRKPFLLSMNTKIISFTEYLFQGIINNFYSPIRNSVIVPTTTETSATVVWSLIKVMLHGTIRDDDFKPNTALQ